MKKLKQIISVVFIATLLISCSEDLMDNEFTTEPLVSNDLTDGEAMLGVNGEYCGSETFTLWAGQTIDAGTLTVSNDASNLYVTYNTTGEFGILHLWVGSDFTLLPINNQGTPIPGQFPYSFDASGTSTYTFTIPLSTIPYYSNCGDMLYVVAHAEVGINGGNETAFGGDIEGTGTNRWYYYADYVVACCDEEPPGSSEELGTAFAKGGYVFTTGRKSNPEKLPSLELTKNRWGWAINLMEAGSYSYELWVGAGLNDVSKGVLVGNVGIVYDGMQATVTYSLFSGYAIEESHIYAEDMMPTTIAPGQYGNIMYFDPFVSNYSVTLDVSDSDGDGVWFIVHAVAYGEMNNYN